MTTIDDRPGEARSPGPSVQELLATDTRPVPGALRDTSFVYQGSADVPKSRYTSPEFAALEAEYLWRRTWQMACHEDEIPNRGDHVVYDVADESLIVVRQGDGSIKAFHNACLHRGTKLRDDDGRVASFRCPFHGWRWDLDGSLVEVPAAWDFPHITGDPARSCLPEAKVARWGGFVFVNMDPDAPPFETYAGKMIEHFRDFPMEGRYKAFHAVKEVPANWKVCMEAFSEAYHVIATHPQILEFCGDANSEYAIWPGERHVTRFINSYGLQSPHLTEELDDQQIVEAYLAFSTRGRGGAAEVGEGIKARQAVAEVFRQRMGVAFSKDLSAVSDAELLDAILYHLFPAFAPWAGVGQPLVYRWRPGPTPDTCYMDVLRMLPVPDEGPRPKPAPVTRLTIDQPWTEAPGMGRLADVFEQDMANLPKVQAGLKSTGKRTVTFSNYQEGRLRMIHRTIDQYILDGLRADGRSEEELAPFRVPEG